MNLTKSTLCKCGSNTNYNYFLVLFFFWFNADWEAALDNIIKPLQMPNLYNSRGKSNFQEALNWNKVNFFFYYQTKIVLFLTFSC
jgi:hypothetical protein